MDLDDGLKTELSAIAGLANKVFSVNVKQGTAAPYLEITMSGADREMHMQGFDGLISQQCEINLFHSTYSGLKSIKKLIISKIESLLLKNIGGTGPLIQAIEIMTDMDDYEDSVKLYKSNIEITIGYEEG